MPSMTKIWVAPESTIASFDAIVNTVYAHFEFCHGLTEENADSRLFVEPSETFDVTTVMLLSSTTTSLMEENIRVGSDDVLITENDLLHVNATLPTIAPNHHICGKTILWWFFIAQLYPWLM